MRTSKVLPKPDKVWTWADHIVDLIWDKHQTGDCFVHEKVKPRKGLFLYPVTTLTGADSWKVTDSE